MKFKYQLIILFLSFNIIVAAEIPTKSVVKIFSSISISDYKNPWQTSKISRYTGSGAIIENNLILTSAHVVSDAVFIEVKKENDPKKYIAKVKYISHQADLALLEVNDEKFYKNTEPLKLNNTVKHREEVTVLGYPIGGNTISTTTGVISRIEYSKYTWSKEFLLAIQIDAAINSGNSGGPAIDKEGQLIGIAMQKLNGSSNISYIVPSIIIETFLNDIKDDKVDGFYYSSTTVNSIENDYMKDYYGLKNGNGVLVTYVDVNNNVLKVDDIIMEIDGVPVANNMTIKSEFGRVNFNLLFHSKQIGSIVNLKILRDRKLITVPYELKRSSKLIKEEFNTKPRYIIFGGLSFTPLTKNYLRTLKMKENEINMLFYKQEKDKERDEIVVWMQTIFPHNINRGYYSGAETITKVNGIKVKNFNHFIQLIDNSETEYTVIDCLEKKKIILKTEEAKNSFKSISSKYYLSNDRRAY